MHAQPPGRRHGGTSLGLLVGLVHALSLTVAPSDVALRVSVALIGGKAMETGSLLEVLVHASSFLVTNPEIKLRQRITLISGPAKPLSPLRVISLDSEFSLLIRKPELRLRIRQSAVR